MTHMGREVGLGVGWWKPFSSQFFDERSPKDWEVGGGLPVLSLESKLEVRRAWGCGGSQGTLFSGKTKNQKNKTPSQLGET